MAASIYITSAGIATCQHSLMRELLNHRHNHYVCTTARDA